MSPASKLSDHVKVQNLWKKISSDIAKKMSKKSKQTMKSESGRSLKNSKAKRLPTKELLNLTESSTNKHANSANTTRLTVKSCEAINASNVDFNGKSVTINKNKSLKRKKSPSKNDSFSDISVRNKAFQIKESFVALEKLDVNNLNDEALSTSFNSILLDDLDTTMDTSLRIESDSEAERILNSILENSPKKKRRKKNKKRVLSKPVVDVIDSESDSESVQILENVINFNRNVDDAVHNLCNLKEISITPIKKTVDTLEVASSDEELSNGNKVQDPNTDSNPGPINPDAKNSNVEDVISINSDNDGCQIVNSLTYNSGDSDIELQIELSDEDTSEHEDIHLEFKKNPQLNTIVHLENLSEATRAHFFKENCKQPVQSVSEDKIQKNIHVNTIIHVENLSDAECANVLTENCKQNVQSHSKDNFQKNPHVNTTIHLENLSDAACANVLTENYKQNVQSNSEHKFQKNLHVNTIVHLENLSDATRANASTENCTQNAQSDSEHKFQTNSHINTTIHIENLSDATRKNVLTKSSDHNVQSDSEDKLQHSSDTTHANVLIENCAQNVLPETEDSMPVLQRHFQNKCDKNKSSDPLILEPDVNITMENSIHLCLVCSKPFANDKTLYSHMMSLHQEDNKICLVCNKAYKSMSGLKSHFKSHVLSEVFECRICNKNFPNIFIYNKHLHTHNTKIECNICSIKFNNKEELDEHKKIHQQKFQCDICETLCFTKATFHKHMTLHSDNKIKCVKCKIKFCNPFELRSHLTELHMRNRAHKCDHCNKFFKTSIKLIKHRQVYKKEVVCHVCQKFFKNGDLLRNHIKNNHNKYMKPYSCRLCNRKFRKERKMKKHFSFCRKKNNIKS